MRSEQPPIDPRVLGRILTLEEAVQSGPGEDEILASITEALPSVPGVQGCLICLRGRVAIGSGSLQHQPHCRRADDDCLPLHNGCRLETGPLCNVQSLRAGENTHGIFAVDVADESAFAPYRPLVANLGRLLALRLDNSHMAAQLHQLNHLLQGQMRAHRSLLQRAETAYVASRQELAQVKRDFEDRVHSRTQQLEEANAELEAFSYSVSHDLREPLRAVDGFSQALMEDFGARMPPEARRFLRSIRSGAQRMETLIDHLLTFSRLSNVPLKKRPITLAALIEEVRTELHPCTLERQIEIRVGQLPECRGDYTLLKQVWINLLSNAIKYTRPRKRAEIEIGCQLLNGEPAFFIRDNGIGFDMRHANRLFTVFQRLHRAEDFEGNGVGLAIVERIVRRHGGRIWAEAEPDHGATFWHTLGSNRSTTAPADDNGQLVLHL